MGKIKREAREVGIIAVLACGEGGYGRICQFQLCLFLISCKCRNMITEKITRKIYNRVFFNSTHAGAKSTMKANEYIYFRKLFWMFMTLQHTWRHAFATQLEARFATQLTHFSPPPPPQRVKMIWLYEHKKGWNNLEHLRKTMRFPVTFPPSWL